MKYACLPISTGMCDAHAIIDFARRRLVTLRCVGNSSLSCMSGIATRLSVRGLRKSFAHGLARSPTRTLAINDIDLDLCSGEILGIAGDAGSGKTTLLQCTCGLLRPDRGIVNLRRDSASIQVDGAIAYVAPVPVYYPFLTVRDVVSLRAARAVSRETKQSTDEALDRVDLRRAGNDLVAMLSPFELVRLSLAEALLTSPPVIMVDTNAAESPVRDVLFRRVIQRIADTGAAVILASRNAAALESIATRTTMLTDGRIADPRCASLFVAERMH